MFVEYRVRTVAVAASGNLSTGNLLLYVYRIRIRIRPVPTLNSVKEKFVSHQGTMVEEKKDKDPATDPSVALTDW